jgi:hypothetical protein
MSALFSTRDHVCPASHCGEEVEDGEVRVGLGGKADQVGNLLEGLGENPEMAGEGGVAVQIKRGPDLLGKGRNGDLFTVQVLTPVVKVVHR